MPGPLSDLRVRLGTRRQIRSATSGLRGAARRATAATQLVDAAFATAGEPISIAPAQLPTEFAAFLTFVAFEKPRRILEVGTGAGGTLYGLAWASAPGADLLSLDLRLYPRERHLLYRTFVEDRHIEAWEADSHLDETRDRVAAYFGGRPLDLVFVDGKHSYDSVSRDYRLYVPLLREGGIVAFHDIVDGPYENVGDVPRFWREMRAKLGDPVEFVESWQQEGYGIGVGRRPGGNIDAELAKSSSPSSSR